MTACKSNLKNIGTALEMYSADHGAKYPSSLQALLPKYLKTLPECPATASVTYQVQFGPDAEGNTKRYAEFYGLRCAGGNHTAVSIEGDYPRYNGVNGLIERADQEL